jgi:pyridoxine kinase
MSILSLQSAVAYGHVGNSAAVFALQRLGFDVWPVDTVQFSNHPGYGTWAGAVTPPAQVGAVTDGLDRVGALAGCRAVLSGYLGDSATGAEVLHAVERVKVHHPAAPYLCDPVMGDSGPGLYVRPGIPEFFAGPALAAADIVTPNRFELELLAGQPVADMAAAIAAARTLLARGPRLVVVTSLEQGDAVACLAVDAAGAWAVRTPLLAFAHPVQGAGDTLAALLLGHLLQGLSPAEALSRAVSGLWGVLARTRELGRRELALVAAQDQLAAPGRVFAAEAV